MKNLENIHVLLENEQLGTELNPQEAADIQGGATFRLPTQLRRIRLT